jgi:S-adenosylmethionine hydrolase
LAPETPAVAGSPDAVFFLSDYGLRDGFPGVVHAVLRRLAPGVAVVDLTHEIAPFDVRAGGLALARAVPWLGPSVALAVIDPGVGSDRRGLVVRVAGAGEVQWLVGPDNGLLVPALEVLGALRAPHGHGAMVADGHGGVVADGHGGVVAEVFVLARNPGAVAGTFDGRDVFAPAVAALCRGTDPATFGVPVGIETLVRLPRLMVERRSRPDGGRLLRSEVTWVDRFGNIQLAARPIDLAPAEPAGRAKFHVTGAESGAGVAIPVTAPVRRVRAYSELGVDELGLLDDADGHLAVVCREGSAAARMGARPGDVATLVW